MSALSDSEVNSNTADAAQGSSAGASSEPMNASHATLPPPNDEDRLNFDYIQAVNTLHNPDNFAKVASRGGNKNSIGIDDIRDFLSLKISTDPSNAELTRACNYLLDEYNKPLHGAFGKMDYAAANLSNKAGSNPSPPDDCIGKSDINCLYADACKVKVTPTNKDGSQALDDKAFNFNAKNPYAALATRMALQQTGKPYVRGSEIDPTKGFDCSGLTKWSYSQAGIDLPRESWKQGDGLQPVSSKQDLQPGDLIVWNQGKKDGMGHVAMYVGNGYIVEAPELGKNVRCVKLDDTYKSDGNNSKMLPIGDKPFKGYYRPTEKTETKLPGWQHTFPKNS